MYMGKTHLFLSTFWLRRLTALALVVNLSSVLLLHAFAGSQTLARADAGSDSSTGTAYSNAGANDFGGTDLDNGQTVAKGAATLVTTGFDDKISFKVGPGATAGVGAGATLQFAVNAEALLNDLGLSSLDGLIEWCQQLVQNPSTYIGQLINEAKDNVAASDAERVEEVIAETVTRAYAAAENILANIGVSSGSALQSLFSGGNTGGGEGHTGGGLSVLSNSRSGGCGGASSGSGGCGGGNYKRDSQFKCWSK